MTLNFWWIRFLKWSPPKTPVLSGPIDTTISWSCSRLRALYWILFIYCMAQRDREDCNLAPWRRFNGKDPSRGRTPGTTFLKLKIDIAGETSAESILFCTIQVRHGFDSSGTWKSSDLETPGSRKALHLSWNSMRKNLLLDPVLDEINRKESTIKAKLWLTSIGATGTVPPIR